MWYGIFKIPYAVWTGTAWRYTYAVTAKADGYAVCGNIFFSFYEQYKGILSLPYNAADKTTVEYYAPENSKVQIFYRHDDKEEYQSEVLSCVAGGVYAKSFSLFYGESIQYYFLEDDGKKKKKHRMPACFVTM